MAVHLKSLGDEQKRRKREAAIRGGSQRNEAAVAWNEQGRARKAGAKDQLDRAILHYFRLIYPHAKHVPAYDGAFWLALCDVTGEPEGTLTTRGAALGIWPWSPQQVTVAVRDRRERQAA